MWKRWDCGWIGVWDNHLQNCSNSLGLYLKQCVLLWFVKTAHCPPYSQGNLYTLEQHIKIYKINALRLKYMYIIVNFLLVSITQTTSREVQFQSGRLQQSTWYLISAMHTSETEHWCFSLFYCNPTICFLSHCTQELPLCQVHVQFYPSMSFFVILMFLNIPEGTYGL